MKDPNKEEYKDTFLCGSTVVKLAESALEGAGKYVDADVMDPLRSEFYSLRPKARKAKAETCAEAASK